MNEPNPYRAAGTFSGPAYTERAADCLLRQSIERNRRYPYMLAPRQSGKSSLIRHTMETLPRADYRCALVDFSIFTPKELRDYDAFLDGFFAACCKSLELKPAVDSEDRTFSARLNAILAHFPQRLVLFLDEVDALSRVAFKDSFFSSIRNVFNERSKSDLARVQFVLAGAARPSDLISDPYRSPFNVGDAIVLADFTLDEVKRIAQHLHRAGVPVADAVPAALYRYASGSVYLTQLILEGLWEEAAEKPKQPIQLDDVDAVVKRIIDRAAQNVHFTNIYQRLKQDDAALAIFRRLLLSERVNDAGRDLLSHTGIGGKEGPFRNEIYERVFGAGGPLELLAKRVTSQLPYAHNPYFTDREQLMKTIHQRLNPQAPTAPLGASIVALVGMGGVGKTTLAGEYAVTHSQHYQDVLWVQAERPLASEFQRVARQLDLIGDPLQPQDADRDAQSALRELNQPTSRLLILDNVLDERWVMNWIPLSGGCRTLITSRFATWRGSVYVLHVPPLDVSDAREFLERRSGVIGKNGVVVERLAHQLGCLPLALEQAAVFIERGGSSFEKYLRLYDQERRKLLDQAGERSVFTALQINVNVLSPLAQVILRLVSFLKLDPIPVALLEDNLDILEAGVDELMRHSRRSKKKNWLLELLLELFGSREIPGSLITQTDVRQALGELAAYSFLEFEQEALSIHPLMRAVQIEIAREGEGEEIWSKWAHWLTSKAPARTSTR